MTTLEGKREDFTLLNDLLPPLSTNPISPIQAEPFPSLPQTIATWADSELSLMTPPPTLDRRVLEADFESMMEEEDSDSDISVDDDDWQSLPWAQKVIRMKARIAEIDCELKEERKAICIEAFGIDEQITGAKLTALRYSHNPGREAIMVKLHEERASLASHVYPSS